MPSTKELKAAERVPSSGPGPLSPAVPGETRSLTFDAAAGLLWMVLLWTWITPIAGMSQWTEPEQTGPLYAATALCILVHIFRVPAGTSILLKALGVWLAVGWLFREAGGHSGFGLDWLRAYGALAGEDVLSVLSGGWDRISAENRTVIFLAGWALLSGVVQSILVYRKRGFWLVASTWIYLLALQLWPGWDTSRELWAAGASGLALLAVLHLERIRFRYATGLVRRRMTEESGAVLVRISAVSGGRRGRMPPVLYAAALALTFLVYTGALAGSGGGGRLMEPMQSDAWYRWAEWLDSSRSAGGSPDGSAAVAALARHGVTGYGSDDRRLGGPLEVLDEPVFTARTPYRTYWRGESKAVYDGRGWSALSPEDLGAVRAAELAADAAGGGGTVFSQELLFTGKSGPGVLFAGGAIESVQGLFTLDGQELPAEALVTDPVSGRHEVSGRQGRIGYARFTVRAAGYGGVGVDGSGGESSRDNHNAAVGMASGALTERTLQAYLQLPAGLPDRVRTLAVQTAAAGADPYAKALLIERYLEGNYRYSLTAAAVPAAGEDFVDRFLFGPEGSGYCDYFSTAMTVMLRSAGVPARWVKGFAPGEQTGAADGLFTMVVSSKDAHSWVEAYVPGKGWVPFDPTPGYSGFSAADGGTSGDLAAAALAEAGQGRAAQAADAVAGGDAAAGETGFKPFGAWQSAVSGAWDRWVRSLAEWLSAHRLAAAAAALAIGLAVWVVRSKGHLLALLLLLRYRRRGRGHPVLALRLLDRLWLRVFRRYGAKPADQTLREYAVEAGERAPEAREALYELVRLYEHVRYAGEPPPWLPRGRMTELWRKLFGRESERAGGIQM